MALAREPVGEPTLVLDKPFYSPVEVAALAGVSSATIHNWIKAGRLVAVQLSERTYRIPRKSILRLLSPDAVRKPTYTADSGAVVE